MTWAGPESGACVSVLVSWNLEEHAHCCVLCGEDTFQASSIYIYTRGASWEAWEGLSPLNLLLQFHSASQEGDREHKMDSILLLAGWGQ